MYKKRLLIDLDGVLNEYGKEKFDENFIPKMKNGAKEFLQELANDYELYLFTTRNSKLAKKWLIENEIDEFFADVTNVKAPAYLQIDDRAICFNGNFSMTIEDVKNFKVYWE